MAIVDPKGPSSDKATDRRQSGIKSVKTPKTAPSDDAPVTKAGKADRRHLRGQASAQRIIDTTIRLIAGEGMAAVTMQRIAGEIGSSNALVVFHFGTKERLFRAALEYLNDQFARLWQETVRRPDFSAAQRILAALDCARHFRSQHPDWVSVWVLFGSDRQTLLLDRQISLPNDRAYLAETRTLLADVAREGGHPDVDTEMLAEGLNYLVQGAWYWDTFNPDQVRSDALQAAAMTLLRNAFPGSF
jgi:AcrR family transcriptional regulator